MFNDLRKKWWLWFLRGAVQSYYWDKQSVSWIQKSGLILNEQRRALLLLESFIKAAVRTTDQLAIQKKLKKVYSVLTNDFPFVQTGERRLYFLGIAIRLKAKNTTFHIRTKFTLIYTPGGGFPLHVVHETVQISFQLPDQNARQIPNAHLTLHAFKKSVKIHVSPLFVA